jgi:hypothetical protein
LCGAIDQTVHALAGFRSNLYRLAEHQREYLMAGGNLGKMHVRLEAFLFDLGDVIRW